MRSSARYSAFPALVLALALGPCSDLRAEGESVVVPVAVSDEALVLKELRRSMIQGDIGTEGLRQLADSGDGLAAFKFGKILQARGTRASDIAHYYAIALYSGRDYAAKRLIALVERHATEFATLSPGRLKSIEDAMLVAARRGNTDVSYALADFYAQGEPFGAKPEATARLLAPFVENGDGKAAMKLALMAIGPDPSAPLDAKVARDMLNLVVASDDLGARTTAANLLPLLPAEGATK